MALNSVLFVAQKILGKSRIPTLCLAACQLAACNFLTTGNTQEEIDKNEDQMQIAIERFVAESDSAGEGTIPQLADRTSAMRQLRLDLRSIEALEECSTLQSLALDDMQKVIDSWKAVSEVENNADPGSIVFEIQMADWRREIGEKVQTANAQNRSLQMLASRGCVAGTDDGIDQPASELDGDAQSSSNTDIWLSMARDDLSELCQGGKIENYDYATGSMLMNVMGLTSCPVGSTGDDCAMANAVREVMPEYTTCINDALSADADVNPDGYDSFKALYEQYLVSSKN